MHVCVSACVCACVRVCACVCVCACVRAAACMRAYVLDGEGCRLFTSRTLVVVQTAVYLTSYSD